MLTVTGSSPTSNQTGTGSTTKVAAGWMLASLLALFLLARTPVMLQQVGGQDEDYFAVPGVTILQDGSPRIPYLPSRNPKDVFYRADERLFVLPPVFFYWQAAVYRILGPSYGSGRLAAAFAGLLTLVLLYRLGRLAGLSVTAALWTVAWYSWCRAFFFPATTARPDILATGFSLAAIWLAWAKPDQNPLPLSSRRWWWASVAAGLACLTHPFGLVVTLQIMGWAAMSGGSVWQRVHRLFVMAGITLATLSLWLLLIWPEWDIFGIQFHNNILTRSGSGLLSRFLFPWPAIIYHMRLLGDHLGAIQCTLLLLGGFCLFLKPAVLSRRDWRLPVLGWSSALLLMILQGEHPTRGYWSLPAAWGMLGLGVGLDFLIEKFRFSIATEFRWRRQLMIWSLGSLIGLSLLPGSGSRTIYHAWRYWGDPRFDRRALVSDLMKTIPPQSRLLVDAAFVLDFYLADRQPILALDVPPFFSAQGIPYDYLVVGPTGLAQQLPKALQADRCVARFGIAPHPFAAYGEVWQAEAVTEN